MLIVTQKKLHLLAGRIWWSASKKNFDPITVSSYYLVSCFRGMYKNDTFMGNVLFSLWINKFKGGYWKAISPLFSQDNNEKYCNFSHLEIHVFLFLAGRGKWFTFLSLGQTPLQRLLH